MTTIPPLTCQNYFAGLSSIIVKKLENRGYGLLLPFYDSLRNGLPTIGNIIIGPSDNSGK